MGQIFVPGTKDIILTDVDRLVARNADGGLSPAAAHVILLGEDSGRNLAESFVIGLGWQAAGGAGAGITSTELAGTTVVGEQAATRLETATNNVLASVNVSDTVIGFEAMLNAQFAGAMVVIGDGALRTMTGSAAGGPETSVVIGNRAARQIAGASVFRTNVVIGFEAAKTAGGAAAVSNSVIIGYQAGSISGTANIGATTCVGYRAGASLGAAGVNPASSTFVGSQAGELADNTNFCTAIGALSTVGVNSEEATALGYSSNASATRATVIGANAICRAGIRSVVIGAEAGSAAATSLANKLLIETYDGVTKETILFGDMLKGVLIVGGSTDAVDRDTGGAGATNLLKILNGTLGAAAPVGGLFLFGNGGELRMQSSGNVEKLLTGTFTVATLPAAAGRAGSKAFVTDALAPAFGAAVVGAGAVFTPVYSDGAAWFVG